MIDWKEKYMREVEGLNNEGDPIGGDPASGLRHQIEALQKELDIVSNRNYELRMDNDALKEERELAKLMSAGYIEKSDRLYDENEALKAESEAIQKELTHWKANHADLKERLHVATHRTDLPSDRLPLFDRLKAENEAQAKRIAELEEHVTKLGSGSRQHLYKAFARRYKEILSLRKENEALHKQVDEHNEWHMMRDEMRKALEAQMNGDSK